jgi:GDP-L-fucose synthase
VAEGVVQALWFGTPSGFVNLGSGKVHTIEELVKTLQGFIDFEYRFDTSKPTGVRKRLLDISLAQETIGYHPSTSLEQGLKKTWQWYIGHPQEYTQKICHFEEGQDQAPIAELKDMKPNPQQPIAKG